MVRIVLPLSTIWRTKDENREAPRPIVPLIRLVSGLLLLHLLEMSVWAAAFAVVGVLPGFETSLYYSLKSYTTVGYGDVLPPVAWRLVGPIEAAVGVLMLGLSTGVIVGSATIGVVATVIASFLPALRVSRLPIVEALRQLV
jgi:ABC-type antimicrobial peptide transport system permease subunit